MLSEIDHFRNMCILTSHGGNQREIRYRNFILETNNTIITHIRNYQNQKLRNFTENIVHTIEAWSTNLLLWGTYPLTDSSPKYRSLRFSNWHFFPSGNRHIQFSSLFCFYSTNLMNLSEICSFWRTSIHVIDFWTCFIIWFSEVFLSHRRISSYHFDELLVFIQKNFVDMRWLCKYWMHQDAFAFFFMITLRMTLLITRDIENVIPRTLPI